MSHKIRKETGFEIFPWNHNFETGIALIDKQHQQLVVLLNRLAQQYVHGLSEPALLEILSELADYAHYHFQSEEEIWKSCLETDPWYAEHLLSHQNFFRHIQKLQTEKRSFQEILEDVFSFLSKWLAFHILDSDKRMARAVLAVKEGLDQASAHKRAEEEMSGSYAVLIQTVLSMYEHLSSQALDLMHEKLARERAEAALKISEERWKFLLENSSGGLWDWSQEQSDIFTDFQSFLLFPEARNQKGASVFADDLERVKTELRQFLLSQQSTFSCKYRVLSQEGEIHWTQLRGKVFARDSKGNPTRLMGSHEDISERELAAQFIKNGHETLLVTDPDFQILKANSRFLQLSGLNWERLRGSDLRSLLSAQNAADLITEMQQGLKEKGFWSGDVWHQRPDGSEFLLDLNMRLQLTPDHRVEQITAIGYDITQSRQTENELLSQNQFQSLLMEFSQSYVGLTPEIAHQEIVASLAKLGEFLDLDRVYIVEYDFENQRCSIAAEWYRAELAPQQEKMQNIALKTCHDWLQAHQNGEPFEILNPQTCKENTWTHALEPEGLQYLMTLPLMQGDQCLGFIGLHALRPKIGFPVSVKNNLKIFSQILSNARIHLNKSQALQNKERFLSDLIENMGAVMYRKDVQGRYLMVNRKWEEVTQLSRETALGKTDLELFPAASAQGFTKTDQQVLQSDQLIEAEEFLESAGKLRYFISIKFPSHDLQGQVNGITGVSTEITDRKRAEEELRKFKTISDQAIHGHVISDLEGKMIYANDYFAKIHGFHSEELQEQLLSYFLSPSQEQKFKLRMAQLQADGFFPPTEVEQIRKDGSVFPMLMSGSLIKDEKGQALFAAITAIDISELKRLEEIQLKAQRAEEANQAKSAFLANMSHEIRTPMNAILGFSQLLSEQNTDPRWQRYLNAINSSGQSLLRIINDILDLSKIEAGKIELQLQPTQISLLCQELKTLLSLSFEQKGLRFQIELPPHCPEWLELDGLRLRQVLLNLLGNALKFTKQGQVTLQISYAPQSDETGELSLSVSDTGIGIAPEQQNQIFEAFEQLSQATGTGLGLTISRSLVQLMGGELLLESTLGKGSTFRMVLPHIQVCAAPVSTALNQRPLQPQNFQPATLLLADDIETNLLLLEEMLHPYPFTLYTARNGSEACELAQKYLPDLVLMDIKMPVMDGIEALHKLRQNEQTASLPIIALTAFSLQNEQENLLKIGFNAYLRKPINQAELLQSLAHFLKTHSEDPTLPEQNQRLELDSHFSKAQAQVLRLKLETLWLPRCEQLQNSVIVDELEHFISEFSEELQLPPMKQIKALLLSLSQALQVFELEKVSDILAEILRELKKLKINLSAP